MLIFIDPFTNCWHATTQAVLPTGSTAALPDVTRTTGWVGWAQTGAWRASTKEHDGRNSVWPNKGSLPKSCSDYHVHQIIFSTWIVHDPKSFKTKFHNWRFTLHSLQRTLFWPTKVIVMTITHGHRTCCMRWPQKYPGCPGSFPGFLLP